MSESSMMKLSPIGYRHVEVPSSTLFVNYFPYSLKKNVVFTNVSRTKVKNGDNIISRHVDAAL